jgi:hypothetical protein
VTRFIWTRERIDDKFEQKAESVNEVEKFRSTVMIQMFRKLNSNWLYLV